jgi:hypothetical protein
MAALLRLGRFAVGLVTGLVAACAAEPTGPVLPGAVYELVLFNGTALPFRFSEQDSTTFYEHLGSRLVFDGPDSLTATVWVHHVSAAMSLDTVYTGITRAAYEVRGRWGAQGPTPMRRFGRGLVISYPCCEGFYCYGPPCPADDVGTVTADRLVLYRDWDARRPVMVYVRVDG